MPLREYRRLSHCDTPWSCFRCTLPPFSDDIFDNAGSLSASVGDGSVLRSPNNPAHGGAPGASSPTAQQAGINKTTSFWYNNCRSLKNKLLDFQTLCASSPQNMTFLLTETWLDPSVADGELLSLDDFTIIRRDRQGIGGGVMMAIPSQLCVNRRTDLEHPDLEGLFVEYHLPRGPILVCCVYCPPSSREQSYRLLDRSLQSASQKNYTNILVFGDFNCHIDWLTHDDPIPCDCADDTLLDAVTTAGFAQVCSEPTYTTRSGEPSYLDLVFTPDPTRVPT